MKVVRLKKGREASLLRRHPWVFSGAIETVEGGPESGDSVLVVSHDRQVLGTGAYSPQSQIRVRLFCFHECEINKEYLALVVAEAVARRKHLENDPERDAFRLVFGESDLLPGLIVDRYRDFLVCQFQSTGMERWKPELVQVLAELTGCRGIYERSESAARKREGLAAAEGVLYGDSPPESLLVREYGLHLEVDIVTGQKTGAYLDQAENRRLVRPYCSGGEVLNCFSYSGAFSMAALQAGATRVTSVDSSGPALKLLQRNLQHSQSAAERHTSVEARVGDLLRDWQKQNRKVELVVLDPPKFADHKSHVIKAARAYKDLALQAVKLIRPGGHLVTFSCSGAIDLKLFQKITADAFLDAGVQGEIVQYLHQSPDHPVALTFPESQYLKGLVCRVTGSFPT